MADLSVTAANVLASDEAKITRGTAGATITAGQTVRLNTTSGKWVLADADAGTVADAGADGFGVALHGAADGQPISVVTMDDDFDPGATATEGVVYCLSATAGGIAPFGDLVTDDYVTILGVGNSSGNIALSPIVSGAQVQ